MREIFSDYGACRYARFEAALARSRARAGVIPKRRAGDRSAMPAELFDIEALARARRLPATAPFQWRRR